MERRKFLRYIGVAGSGLLLVPFTGMANRWPSIISAGRNDLQWNAFVMDKHVRHGAYTPKSMSDGVVYKDVFCRNGIGESANQDMINFSFELSNNKYSIHTLDDKLMWNINGDCQQLTLKDLESSREQLVSISDQIELFVLKDEKQMIQLNQGDKLLRLNGNENFNLAIRHNRFRKTKVPTHALERNFLSSTSPINLELGKKGGSSTSETVLVLLRA